MAEYTTKIKKIRTNHVKTEVFFGSLAPHLGQLFAVVLTCSPHSLHLTRATFFPLRHLKRHSSLRCSRSLEIERRRTLRIARSYCIHMFESSCDKVLLPPLIAIHPEYDGSD